MKFNTIIALDPSGNFTNGSGGTGVAIYSDAYIYEFTTWAKHYETKDAYYGRIKEHLEKIFFKPALVVIEDFRLQTGKAKAQSNQTMETSELIGKIEEWCRQLGLTCVRQQNTVKARWKDELMMKELKELGFEDKPSSRHSKDALRHLLHAIHFTQKKVGK